MSRKNWQNHTDGGKQVYPEKKKTFFFLFRPPKIPRELTRDRTQASAV